MPRVSSHQGHACICLCFLAGEESSASVGTNCRFIWPLEAAMARREPLKPTRPRRKPPEDPTARNKDPSLRVDESFMLTPDRALQGAFRGSQTMFASWDAGTLLLSMTPAPHPWLARGAGTGPSGIFAYDARETRAAFCLTCYLSCQACPFVSFFPAPLRVSCCVGPRSGGRVLSTSPDPACPVKATRA
jgi:hypothetical protein